MTRRNGLTGHKKTFPTEEQGKGERPMALARKINAEEHSGNLARNLRRVPTTKAQEDKSRQPETTSPTTSCSAESLIDYSTESRAAQRATGRKVGTRGIGTAGQNCPRRSTAQTNVCARMPLATRARTPSRRGRSACRGRMRLPGRLGGSYVREVACRLRKRISRRSHVVIAVSTRNVLGGRNKQVDANHVPILNSKRTMQPLNRAIITRKTQCEPLRSPWSKSLKQRCNLQNTFWGGVPGKAQQNGPKVKETDRNTLCPRERRWDASSHIKMTHKLPSIGVVMKRRACRTEGQTSRGNSQNPCQIQSEMLSPGRRDGVTQLAIISHDPGTLGIVTGQNPIHVKTGRLTK